MKPNNYSARAWIDVSVPLQSGMAHWPGDPDPSFERLAKIEAGDICPIVVLAPERMAALPDVSTAEEMGIPVSFSTVRGFVVHADTPDDVAMKIEEALMNAMGHTVYQGFLTSVGLDSTSVAGSDVWGGQIETMVTDMQGALKELGFIE